MYSRQLPEFRFDSEAACQKPMAKSGIMGTARGPSIASTSLQIIAGVDPQSQSSTNRPARWSGSAEGDTANCGIVPQQSVAKTEIIKGTLAWEFRASSKSQPLS